MKKRLNVHLYVTPICNLKCMHCYYEAKDMDFSIDRLLSFDDLKFIIISLIDNYDAYFDIEGGELYLRKNIATLFNSLKKKYLERLTITTNGTIDFDYHEKYLKHLSEFRISFEGDSDILQKDIRGITLAKPLNSALNLLNSGVEPTIRITLHKKNYNHLNRMIEYFYNYGFKKFSFYEFQESGRGVNNHNYSLSEKELIEILKAISLINNDISYKFNFSNKRVNIVKSYPYNTRDISHIPSLTINYNGKIGICPWQIDKDVFSVFNIYNFNQMIKEKMKLNYLTHDCNHCSYIRITNA